MRGKKSCYHGTDKGSKNVLELFLYECVDKCFIPKMCVLFKYDT